MIEHSTSHLLHRVPFFRKHCCVHIYCFKNHGIYLNFFFFLFFFFHVLGKLAFAVFDCKNYIFDAVVNDVRIQ